MGGTPDWYAILQVHPQAEPDVVDAAFRRLSKKFHPDVNRSPDATARMRDLNLAHAVLANPRARADYDRALAAARAPARPVAARPPARGLVRWPADPGLARLAGGGAIGLALALIVIFALGSGLGADGDALPADAPVTVSQGVVLRQSASPTAVPTYAPRPTATPWSFGGTTPAASATTSSPPAPAIAAAPPSNSPPDVATAASTPAQGGATITFRDWLARVRGRLPARLPGPRPPSAPALPSGDHR